MQRRSFIQSIIGSSIVFGTGGSALTGSKASATALSDPASSGIDHIVVVTMENRSFDHLLGWLPGANGRQAGLSYTDRNGIAHPSYLLSPDYIGCGHPDPDHSYDQSRVAYDAGAMDGFLRAGQNDVFAIGYYGQADIPFYAALAQTYAAHDNWYASILGPTFANRMFIWAAQTDRLDDSVNLTSLPTIFDRLSKAGVSHRYYFNNLPYLALWGFRYFFSSHLFATFLSDAAHGTLPSVSFVDPIYTVLDDGTGNDDHPHADIRNGDAFLSRVFYALANGPKWSSTVLIVLFDEWGGFFEHVAPPRVVAPNQVDTDLQNGNALLGFRVPAVIASPFTYGRGVDHTVYDHTAALKLIEWRWGLNPLTARDASSAIGNPAASFNFATPNAIVPTLPQPQPVFAPPCFEGGIFSSGVAPASPSSSVPQGTPRPTEMSAFAQTDAVQQWVNHPRFRDALRGTPSSLSQ